MKVKTNLAVPRSEPLPTNVTVRFSEQQLRIIDEACELDGRRRSDLVRQGAMKESRQIIRRATREAKKL